MPPNHPWGTSIPLPQISRRLGELLCLSHATRVVSPHPVPSWAVSGTQELCQGGGEAGRGLAAFRCLLRPILM